MTIWFTSDTHYGHQNIVNGESSWSDKSGCRPFNTLNEMNDSMVGKINERVHSSDTLYHIGDWSMGGFENISQFRDRLVCQTIHLIYGNHDQDIRRNHRGVRDLFTSVRSLRIETIQGQRIVMCHFPLLVWEDHHLGVWHLHGHCHGHLLQTEYYQRKVLDIGIDTHADFRPYSFEEIQNRLSNRSIRKMDHH